MKPRVLLSVLAVLLLAAASVPASARERPDASPPALTAAGLEEEALLLLEDEDGPVPPDLRVLVAAPRVAVIGKASSALLVMRPGRTLNVEAGERVRFLAGVREAVWYRGGGLVQSHLQLSGGAPGEPPVQLGEDSMSLPGGAPAIDHGRTRVDLAFDRTGEFAVVAGVAVRVKPAHGKARGDSRAARYLVRVHSPGVLGSIGGFVGRAEDGQPLPGYPVVALDAATGEAVGAARAGGDGRFEILRLPPGDYLVTAPGRRGFEGEFFQDSPDASGGVPVNVSAGTASPGVDFLLDRP